MLLGKGLWLVWRDEKCLQDFDGETESERPLEDLGIDGSIFYKILKEIGSDAMKN